MSKKGNNYLENNSVFQAVGDLVRLPGSLKKFRLIKDGEHAKSFEVKYSTSKSYLFQILKTEKTILQKSMSNVEKVSSYLKKYNYSVVYFHRTNSEKTIVEFDNKFWRVSRYYQNFSPIADYDSNSLEDIGRVIGFFQYLTKDFDTSLLETIPSIHINKEAAKAIVGDYAVESNKAFAVQDALNSGVIPKRVSLGNVELSTFLIGGRRNYYLNLDNVASGSWLSDFAGAALTFCLKKTSSSFDLSLFESYAKGYLSFASTCLSSQEKHLLAGSLLNKAIEKTILEHETDENGFDFSAVKDIKTKSEDISSIIEQLLQQYDSIKEPSIFDMDLERDYSKADSSYKAGQYMDLTIPHFIKPKGGKGYAFFKRAFDIFNSLLAILVLSPFLLLIGLLVKFTSKGPVFYVSKRVGKNGRVFNFYKFRSMYKDAEERLNDLLEKNEIKGGITFKIKNDPRITPFGKFIRKTSIDELPQLFNILKGDMSIIGPRAPLPREVEMYPEEAYDRLLVPQGLSGEWQANGRSDTTFDEMIKMDLDYIENKRSFWYDLKLVFKTIIVVIKGKGAE